MCARLRLVRSRSVRFRSVPRSSGGRCAACSRNLSLDRAGKCMPKSAEKCMPKMALNRPQNWVAEAGNRRGMLSFFRLRLSLLFAKYDQISWKIHGPDRKIVFYGPYRKIRFAKIRVTPPCTPPCKQPQKSINKICIFPLRKSSFSSGSHSCTKRVFQWTTFENR